VALYLEHFGLDEPPFRITPHTDFFFEGAERGATLEALAYAVLHDEGIVKVSGEVGSGKTMLCRMLMERLPPEAETIYLATPSLAQDEILHAIADELELKLSERRTVALRELQHHLINLYANGRRVVILIDEAHVMPEDTLEQVRLLSNLESSRHKLLQIVLFGQPELDATLGKPSLRQLRDRVTHSFRMRPLAEPEVARYLAFRMRAAGYRGPDLFTARAAKLLARASGGLTRRINILADKSLLAAYSDAAHAITERHVKAAVADSEFAATTSVRPAIRGPVLAAAGLALGLALGAGLQWFRPPPALPEAHAIPTPAPKPAADELESELDLHEALESVLAMEAEAAAPAAPRLTATQRERLAAYGASGYKLLAERLAATSELLDQAPDERYALELFVTDNAQPARMERFLMRARDMVPIAELFVIPIAGAERNGMRVIYGTFASEREALDAERRLPPKYQRAFRVAPRRFDELRGEM
jgi:MSHA biogenesis protein MshM